MIKITRKNEYADRIRNYKILIDGNLFGTIKPNETISLYLPNGNHNIYLKIDWCKSNKINFTLSEKENLHFECGNNLKGWKLLISILYITILKNRYLWIKKI